MVWASVRVRGISNFIAILLLIVSAVAASIIVYHFVAGFVHSGSEPVFCGLLRIIHAYRSSSGEISIAVMNVGECPVTLDTIYFLDSNGRVVATLKVNGSLRLSLWGGDHWILKHGRAERVESGLILYDEFNTLNADFWRKRVTSNAGYASVGTSSGYLNIYVKSESSGDWAVAGVSTRSTIQLPNTYVIETELYKYGRASWNYAVCFYITAVNSSDNPYSNTPWIAFKLYPRGSTTRLQVVYRDGGSVYYRNIYSWYGSRYPHAHVLAQISGNSVRVWAWDSTRDTTPEVEGETYELPTLTGRNAYVFLTVDNPTTYVDNGRIGYIKVYRDLRVVLEGLKPGQAYKLVDEEGRTCTIRASSEKVVLDFMNPPKGCENLRTWLYRNGFPWKGVIVSDTFRTVAPGETYIISVHVTDASKVTMVKVCAVEGICVIAPLTHY